MNKETHIEKDSGGFVKLSSVIFCLFSTVLSCFVVDKAYASSVFSDLGLVDSSSNAPYKVIGGDEINRVYSNSRTILLNEDQGYSHVDVVDLIVSQSFRERERVFCNLSEKDASFNAGVFCVNCGDTSIQEHLGASDCAEKRKEVKDGVTEAFSQLAAEGKIRRVGNIPKNTLSIIVRLIEVDHVRQMRLLTSFESAEGVYLVVDLQIPKGKLTTKDELVSGAYSAVMTDGPKIWENYILKMQTRDSLIEKILSDAKLPKTDFYIWCSDNLTTDQCNVGLTSLVSSGSDIKKLYQNKKIVLDITVTDEKNARHASYHPKRGAKTESIKLNYQSTEEETKQFIHQKPAN